eukprot:2276969-Amphidinium_carterae.1
MVWGRPPWWVNAVAPAISGYWIMNEGLEQRPSFRTASNVDMLRDCSAEDGKIWARWGAVALAQHHRRFPWSNSFLTSVEPQPGASSMLSQDKLIEMISCCVIDGMNNVYIRMASPRGCTARVFPYPLDSCKEVFGCYKNGESVEVLLDDMDWCIEFVDACFMKRLHELAPEFKTYISRDLSLH